MLHWLLHQFSWKSHFQGWSLRGFPLEIRLVPGEQTILLFPLRYHILSTHNIGNCISNNCGLTSCTIRYRQGFCCAHGLLVLEWEKLYLKTQNCSNSLSTEVIIADMVWFFSSNGCKVINWSTPYFLQESWGICYCLFSSSNPGLRISWGFAFVLSENKTFIWSKISVKLKTILTMHTMQFTYQLLHTRSLSPAGLLIPVAEFSLPCDSFQLGLVWLKSQHLWIQAVG